MDLTHYMDFTIREGSLAHDLHARLLMAAHFQHRAEEAVVISFPDWKERPGEFGLLFRVFGSEVALQSYARTVAPLVAAELIRAYPAQTVPAGNGPVYRFLRDRRHDKLSGSAIRRLVKRAEARGEVWSPKPERLRNGGDHYLTIPSTSNQQTFRLYIRRDKGRDVVSGISYGLGIPVPSF